MDAAAVELGNQALAVPEGVGLEEATSNRDRRIEPRPREPLGVEQRHERLLELVAGDPDGFSGRQHDPQRPHSPVPWIPLDQAPHGNRTPQPPHFQLVKCPLYFPRRRDGGKVEYRPRRRRHRNPLNLRHLVGPQLHAVSDHALHGPELARPGHFRHQRAGRHDPPETSRRTVAEHRIGTSGNDSRHPPTLFGQGPIADRVDAAMQPQQLPAPHPTRNHTPTQPRPRNCRAPTTPCCASASSATPTANRDPSFARLRRLRWVSGGTPLRLTGGGAPVVRGSCHLRQRANKKGPSPPLPPLALIPSNEGGCLLPTPRGPKTPGSRAVCVGSNGETALVRARALAQPYHRGRPCRA